MTYRINAGAVPPDSWVQDQEIGGGRIIGEVCHFLDLLTFLAGSLPLSIYASAMADPYHHHDTLNAALRFHDGSIGTVSYFSNGDKGLPKEYLEVFSHGATAIVNDFKTMTLYSKGRKTQKKLLSQDKGQKNEVSLFLGHIHQGQPGNVIPVEELFTVTRTVFKALESLQSNQTVTV